MRLAVVARHVHRGESLPVQALHTVRGLAERGHEIELLTIAATCERDMLPGVVVRDVPVRVSKARLGLAWEIRSFARRAAAMVSPERYDLVYTRLPGTWVSDVLNVPGLVDGEMERWIAGREESGLARRLKDRLQPVVRPVISVRRRLERQALGYPGLLFAEAATPAIRDKVLAASSLPPERVVWAPPGVSFDELRPVERPANQVTSLLFCGHAFRRKGLDRVVEALARMREPARLVVVGGDDPAPFVRLAQAAGVADRIEFAGAVRDSAPYFRAADILVFPSRADVWASVVIEGMAAGLPVVTSTGSGAALAVEDGETGFVLREPVDVGALAAALDSLVADPQRRAQMGRAGREATAFYGWPAHLDRVEALVGEAAALRSRPS
jgi:glycosyltransferase involved in cell wall biosynthesis